MADPVDIRQTPEPGGYIILHRGDVLTIALSLSRPAAGSAFLRTNLGRGAVRRAEQIARVERSSSVLARDWHDVAMRRTSETDFEVTLPVLEVGRFEAKSHFLPEGSHDPLWPAGPNLMIKVEPAENVRGNTLYSAFVRQFGPHMRQRQESPDHAGAVRTLEGSGYAVIPLSGTFRALARELDAIITKLRCRILQLLPIHPTPTTYARMGRFGSPFAALDYFDVDPALAEFDRRTTPLQQFDELVDAVHGRNARIFLDIPVNHTGWASRLQVAHPDWFARDQAADFLSPGAWGVTWEDLSELDYRHRELWRYMALVFLFWCRRGVDGFRCDAGYKLPREVWEYIVAKVRREFPDTVFLLEGLGGKLSVMEELLDAANLDWAYSELFQNHDRRQVEAHLSYCLRISSSKGLLIHFAETHDNNRLASRSHRYARLRTALAALCSEAGAFGIANGVEWYADEKVDVHGAPSLRWGHEDNMADHLRRLNTILHSHPCFRAGAAARLLDSGRDNAIALLRRGRDGAGGLLVAANLDEAREAAVSWPAADHPCRETAWDLVSGNKIAVATEGNRHVVRLSPEEIVCIAPDAEEKERLDAALRDDAPWSRDTAEQRARATALDVRHRFAPDTDLAGVDVEDLARRLLEDPRGYCGTVAGDAGGNGKQGLAYPPVVTWEWPRDTRRVVAVPPGHFVLVLAPHPFCATVEEGATTAAAEKSLRAADGRHFALIMPRAAPENIRARALRMRVFVDRACRRAAATLLYLPPPGGAVVKRTFSDKDLRGGDRRALLTNGRGAMSQTHGAWGFIDSQYDAILAGNLDPECPSDRRVMLTRCRAWLVFRGHYQDIDLACLKTFRAVDRRTAVWSFHIPTSNGNAVEIDAELRMFPDRNAVSLTFRRGTARKEARHLPDRDPVQLIIRPDIEDRIHHEKTKAWKGAQWSWPGAVAAETRGFTFRPAADRCLRVRATAGEFTPQPEWTYNVPHPAEAGRGLEGVSDLFSPGYFKISLAGAENAVLTAAILTGNECLPDAPPEIADAPIPDPAPLVESLKDAMRAFIVKRNASRSVIAGYPWFLDWGRDTLVCLRGMIAAGLLEESADILREFARYESGGTLPNMIRGRDVSNRDTSDAPLWFFVACSDLVGARRDTAFLSEDCGGRKVIDVLRSIARNYRNGTSNGIRMDEESGLIFSPSHFTWMDTNYPAGTPRQGYPVEIQALWFAGLTFLNAIDPSREWQDPIRKVVGSIPRLYPVRHGARTYLSDCLHARTGQSAKDAMADDALRPNQLLAITLGCVSDPVAMANILHACEPLLVPGAIRTLADQPVRLPLRIARDGNLLNDPHRPYWGEYSGDEDTRRKPAYHNGTAWVWLFPSYGEAMEMTYGRPAREAALAWLGGCSDLANRGCVGQLPEITDGDAPHTQRGCGAQAWSVTEMYRVLAKLSAIE